MGRKWWRNDQKEGFFNILAELEPRRKLTTGRSQSGGAIWGGMGGSWMKDYLSQQDLNNPSLIMRAGKMSSISGK